MAFIKLFPSEERGALPISDLIRQLRDEFEIVDTDEDAGRDHVAGMIAATFGFSDTIPGKEERLNYFLSVQNSAVYVSFGDESGNVASCCAMPDSALFFGSRDEVDGPSRPLVERAALALGYTLFEG